MSGTFEAAGPPSPGEYVDRALDAPYVDRDWEYAIQNLLRFDDTTLNAGILYSSSPLERILYSSISDSILIGDELRSQKRLRSICEAVGVIAANLLDNNMLSYAVDSVYCNQSKDQNKFIVYHGMNNIQRSIVVFDNNYPIYGEARVVDVRRIIDVVGEMRFFMQEKAQIFFKRMFEQSIVPSLAEIFAIARPQIIVAPTPFLEPACVPDPGWKAFSYGQNSTVGALVRNEIGGRGVTVCFHGTGPTGTDVAILDGADCYSSVVEKHSEVMDTCFVPTSDNWRPAGVVGRRGLLTSRAPGGSEPHYFDGGASGRQETRVVGVDFGLPFTSPGRQLCVHTQPDIEYGDSGSALINEDDRLVGFAFQRTPFGAPNPMSFASWIWAASAMSELGLQLGE